MSRWRTYRRLLRGARPYRRKLVVALTSAIVVALALPTMPLFVRAAIDKAIFRGAERVDGRLVMHPNFRLLALLIGGMLVVGLVKATGHGLRRQKAGEISIGVEGDLRERLYNHVQALDVGYHERISTGQIMSRATSDINAIRQYLMSLGWSVTLVLQVLVMFVVLFVLDWQLAVIFTAVAPFMGWYTYRFANKFDPIVWRMQQNLGELASVVEESVVGVRVVKAFGREGDQVRKMAQDADRVYDAAMESIRLRARFVPLFNAVPTLGLVAVLYFGGRQAIAGDLSTGTIAALFQYLFLLIQPLRSIGMIIAWAQRATTASTRIYEVLDTSPGIADHDDATKLESSGGALAWKDVFFAYPDGGPVLQGVSLDVPAGSSIALVGQTGCGKSTLMRMLPRFIEPTSGTVTIDGQDVSGVTLSTPDADRFSYGRDYLVGRIKVALGGRVAEEIVYGSISAGAESDIQQLTGIARQMVGRWGMSDAIGPIAVVPTDGQASVLLPGAAETSAETHRLVDEEVRRIVDNAHEEVAALLRDNRERLDGLARALLDHETLDMADAYAAAGLDAPVRPTEPAPA